MPVVETEGYTRDTDGSLNFYLIGPRPENNRTIGSVALKEILLGRRGIVGEVKASGWAQFDKHSG